MLERLGLLTTRRPRQILAVAALLVVVAALFGSRAPGRLDSGGFTAASSPSQQAQNDLEASFGGGKNLVILIKARTGEVTAPAVATAGNALAARLGRVRGVSGVESYWSTRAPGLLSVDRREALIIADVAGSDSVVETRTTTIVKEFAIAVTAPGPVTVLVGGQAGVTYAVTTQIAKDLKIAEGIAIPITAILLILAFGSAIAALLPLAIGLLSIVATLFVLFVLSGITQVSIYAINLTTALGLGLGIDYALLMVSRYREELAAGRDPRDAVHASVASAGRTILFSAFTVAAALAALLVFPVYFLKSFAYAGISVVAISVAAALVVLPALLAVLGDRVNAWSLPWGRASRGRAESPFWRKVATRVMARPIGAGLAVVAVLVLAGVPFLSVRFGTPDDRVLPSTTPARQVGNALRDQFVTNTGNLLDVVTSRSLDAGQASAYARRLSSVPGVTSVTGPTGSYARGAMTEPAVASDHVYAGTRSTWLAVEIAPDPLSSAAGDVVREVRAVAAPEHIGAVVGGQAAVLVDQLHDIGSALPLALGLVAATTFLILFLFTGSVILPLKALVLNSLGLSAVFGAIVFVFQQGHLQGLLGFTPTPTSATMLPLLFCIAFGLSMDYEVFLLSRIKELHDAGASNTEAVAGGLARAGRIVSTAAALLAVTFFAFGLSKVSFIKMFGLGTAIAILLDATLVRGVLVPAFMRVAGEWNWWAPRPIRRLHEVIGLADSPPPPTPRHVPA